ncbi:hypothetical protein LCM17_03110 [Cereibacter sphaeroides]|nr:hypothetical protein [Cereibacter sphaeroides]
MEIAFHLGVHQTDKDFLVRCLMRNREALLQQGIAVPSPSRYRQQLRQLAFEMRGAETSAETQEALLDGILDEDDVQRVVFSAENQLSLPRWVVSDDQLYHAAADRVALLKHLFPEASLQLYLAIRNPASFLPALVADDKSGKILGQIQKSDPLALRWSRPIAEIAEALPDVPITVWCEEDVPLLWPEVLRAVSGHSPELVLDGWLARYWSMVTPEAHEAMRRWFQNNPPIDDASRRKTLSVMLSRMAKPEAVESEPMLPGWTEATVDALDALYEEDIDLIATLPGVTLLEI